MKNRSRKTLAVIGSVAGVALLFFELRHFALAGSTERWFWLLVGGLLTVLGGIELFSSPPRSE
jgi:hypothetical protein